MGACERKDGHDCARGFLLCLAFMSNATSIREALRQQAGATGQWVPERIVSLIGQGGRECHRRDSLDLGVGSDARTLTHKGYGNRREMAERARTFGGRVGSCQGYLLRMISMALPWLP